MKRWILFILIVVSGLLVYSCTNSTGISTDPDEELDIPLADIRAEMARHIAGEFILPAYEDLQSATQLLQSSALSLTEDQSEAKVEEVRSSLKSAWLTWQVASIYQFGPTETNALRASINTYPADEQKIDENISKGEWTFGSIANKGAEGFPALDYLLNNKEDNQTIISRFKEDANFLLYIQDVAQEIHEKVVATDQAWLTGSFLVDFTSESSDGTDVGSALGLLVNAIDLHFQRFLRDGKVAIPAGVRSAGVTRPRATEAYHGGYSKELLIKGLEAYVDLFSGRGVTGRQGVSFTYYLDALDQEVLGTDMLNSLEAAIATVSQLEDDLSSQIESDNDKMIEAFIALQEFVTFFKSDMTSVMGITITNQDNDGD